jgi:hypothetical protein
MLVCASGEGRAQPLSGLVQTDYQRSQESEDQLDPGTGEQANRDRFLVRRARLRAQHAWSFADATVEVDFNTVAGARVGSRHVEAAVFWTGPETSWSPRSRPRVRLGAGLFRAPFLVEVGDQSDAERLFAERSLMAQAFFPGEYDVGAQVSGELDWLRVVLAVQNGEPIGSRAFPAEDPNAAKDVLGRVVVRARLGAIRIEGGFAAVMGYGFHPGTQPTEDTFVWRDANEDGIVQLGEIQAVPGASGTPSENFDRWGFQGDLRAGFRIRPLGDLWLFAEGALAENLDRGVRPADPVFLGRDQRALGAYVGIVQEIGRRWLLGVRFDTYRPELDRTELQGGELVRSEEVFSGYTGALALRFGLADGIPGRAVVDYTHKADPLGRDAAGRPTDLRNDVLTTRLQLEF